MRTSLPSTDISAIFADMVVKPALSRAVDKAVAKPHSSGNPVVYLLPCYALLVMGVLNWVQNELPKWYGR